MLGGDLMSEDIGVHWLLRRKSSQLFAASATIVLASGVFMFGLYLFSFKFPVESLNSNPIFVTVCLTAAILTVPAALYILVGMICYWVRFDTSGRFNKTVWFVLFLVAAWYGASLYYFAVYRRQLSPMRAGQLAI
jgi:hypothetical protein